MKKAALHNLGCKVNSYETEAMREQLEKNGYEIVPFEEWADVYVINTCTVTQVADRKSRQMLHRAKKKNPDALVVAVGCYVQADRERALADEAVDLVVGNDQKGRLAEFIEQKSNAVSDELAREYEPLHIQKSSDHTRAFLKIQDGCNQFCSYCLIPYVRGRVRSRKQEEIIEEAKTLAESGCQEIVLTGIHISSYGTDKEEGKENALIGLLCELEKISSIQRIRLGSLEPRLITEEIVSANAQKKIICPHFHLSLQSGSNSVLKRMNRHYTAEEYEEKCHLLRDAFDQPAITTDVIVGFPGETEEEFQETCKFLERIKLYEAHIFPYSRREGTRAAAMPKQVPEGIKKERSEILLKMSDGHFREFQENYWNKPREILLEEKVLRQGESVFVGYTREYVRGYVPAERHHTGEIVVFQPE